MRAALGWTLAALAAASPGAAERVLEARLADIEIEVDLRGHAQPDEPFSVLAPIEGRVEQLVASTGTWVAPGRPLAYMVEREFAAIIDTRGSLGLDFLQERWRRVYRPQAVQAAGKEPVLVLQCLTAPRRVVKAKTPLFEAARALRVAGRVAAADRRWLAEGQDAELWLASDPSRRYRSQLKELSRKADDQGYHAFAAVIPAEADAALGRPWEGVVRVKARRNVLAVPTQALEKREDGHYLKVRVSPGLSTPGLTEIRSGLEHGQPYLAPEEPERAPQTPAPRPAERRQPVAHDPAPDDPYAE